MAHRFLDSVQHARGMARDLLHDGAFESVVYRGTLTGTPLPLSVHYLGRRRFSADVTMFLAEDTPAREHQDPENISGLTQFMLERRHLQRHPEKHDVTMLDTFLVPGELSPEPLFSPYVDARLPVMRSLEEQLARIPSVGTRKKMQRTLRHGVAYHLSHKQEDFDRFYDGMYVPTAVTRFGTHASVAPREELEEHFRKSGVLLLVDAHDGAPASAALLCTFSHRPGLLHYWKVGVEHCDALKAAQLTDPYNQLEAALLLYAVQQRFEEVHMGLTRALPHDGVFMHKRRMGCTFHRHPDSVELALRFRAGVAPRVLERCPLLLWKGDQPVVWLGRDRVLDAQGEAALAETLHDVTFPSVKKVTLFIGSDVRNIELVDDAPLMAPSAESSRIEHQR